MENSVEVDKGLGHGSVARPTSSNAINTHQITGNSCPKVTYKATKLVSLVWSHLLWYDVLYEYVTGVVSTGRLRLVSFIVLVVGRGEHIPIGRASGKAPGSIPTIRPVLCGPGRRGMVPFGIATEV